MMNYLCACLLMFSLSFCEAVNNSSTVANDFVFTIFNANLNNGALLYVIVSNNNNALAHVTVTSPYTGFSTIRVTVESFSVLKILILPMSIEDQYLGGTFPSGKIVVENKGIRLVSDQPVAVHVHAEVTDGDSADTFLVIPTALLGTQYVAVTSTNPELPNIIAIVAYQDNTQVTIGTQTTTLNALQVASIASFDLLSGTMISGNKPFAAISGCTFGAFAGAGDYEAVMLLPVNTWGTEFVAIPLMYLSTNWYQVVSNTDNTVVLIDGNQIAKLNAGEYRRFQASIGVITSNYPIQLIQMGQNVGTIGGIENRGDPFFLQLASTKSMSNTNALFQPTGFIKFHHHDVPFIFVVRIVTKAAGTGTIQLDGNTINALLYKRVPRSSFYYYETIVSNSTHAVHQTNSAAPFTVISYSYGQNEGMGFVCGFTLPLPGQQNEFSLA